MMKNPEADSLSKTGANVAESPEGSAEAREELIKAERISTIFDDAKTLEGIADKLLGEGVISGFSIEPVRSGYIHRGEKVKEDQYSLNILLASDAPPEVRERVRRIITTTIGEKWEAPAIKEDSIEVNREFLGFIRRADVEHKRYVKERHTKLAFALTAALSISGVIGTLVKQYGDERERRAVATEHSQTLERLSGLERKISKQVFALEAQIEEGKPLTYSPNDMAATSSFDETQEILETVRQVEGEVLRLVRAEGKPQETAK